MSTYITTTKIIKEWTDYNEHMNMAYYVLIFDKAWEIILEKFKSEGILNSRIEGKESEDWKLVDGMDLIVHIFNPEKRKFYDLEKMWSEFLPKERLMI